MNIKLRQKGFTLIELLVVISIIAILVAVIFVALNPLELFAKSRNAQRWMKVSELLTAIHLDLVSSGGAVPNESSWASGTVYVLGTDSSGCNTTCTATTTNSACLDLSDLIDNKRISQIPMDPKTGTDANTDIYVYRDETIITVGMCDPEAGEIIKLTR
ncbi:MAG: prepilin-type N-terminal cleavage/methylation domain-containing protein [Patescibacteria group bacterium]|nr:prepilin-type N-terminal cleavage/methylation domain-containing protein [Patescibacteria group bacterium]MDD4610990.1 prepilin-type N-terminal cleavage/methylation domain-containing protein [Patescibacteria group bacterium]